MPIPATQEEFSKILPTIGLDPSLKLGSPEATRELLKPVSVITTATGEKVLTRAGETITKLSPLPTAPTAIPPDKSTSPPLTPQTETPKETTENTALDKTTGTPISFEDAMKILGNDFTGAHRTASGDYILDDTALARAGIKGLGTKTDKEDQKTREALATAQSELTSAISQLKTFDTSKDPALQATISGIENRWNARISDMERITKSRTAALTQTGIRLGSRYTGGMFGGIITEEERQGVARVADLESQKNLAISEAKNAYDTKQWNRYVDLANFAEKAYTKQLDLVKDINKAQAEQDKKLQDEERQTRQDTAIASIMAGGISDVPQIIGELKKRGITTATAKDIEGVLDAIAKTTGGDLSKASNGIEAFGVLKKQKGLPVDILGIENPTEQLFAFLKKYNEAQVKPLTEYQQEQLTLSQERLALARERGSLIDMIREITLQNLTQASPGQIVNAKTKLPVKLTDTETQFLSQAAVLTRLTQEVKDSLDTVGTSGLKGWVVEKGFLVPVVQDALDPDSLDLMQKIYGLNNLFVYFSTGKQLNVTEFERLAKQTPNFRATVAYNERALKNFGDNIQSRLDAYLERRGWEVKQEKPDLSGLGGSSPQDFLNTPLPTGAGGEYNPDIWNKAQ